MDTKATYSIKLGNIIDEFQLEEINAPVDRERLVKRNEVNRPGLALSGFFGYFEPGRIQIIGLSENDYITHLDEESLKTLFDKFFSLNPVAVVFSTSLPVSQTIIDIANKYGVPLLRTESKTSEFMAALIASLSISLAPRITRHGVLVEVYGEGILILGDSGVGKSETAIELVPAYGKAVKTYLSIINEITVGVIAIDGKLTPADARKAAKLMTVCDNFSIPVVTVVNCPGFEYTSENEKAPFASLKHSAQIIP